MKQESEVFTGLVSVPSDANKERNRPRPFLDHKRILKK